MDICYVRRYNARNNLTTQAFSEHGHACFQQEQQIPAKSVFHWEDIQVFKKNTTRESSVNPASPQQVEHERCAEAGSNRSCAAPRSSAVPGYRSWLNGVVVPIMLTFHSVPWPAHTSCTGGQTLLEPPPQLTNPTQGEFLGSSGRGTRGNTSLLLQVSPQNSSRLP